MDGVPQLTQRPIEPGASFDYVFTCPDAGTFWYRAVLPGGRMSALSGLFVVEESEPISADREVALFLHAPRLHPPLDAPQAWPGGGNERREARQVQLAVNGAESLDIPVRMNERLRLRLVNGSVDLALVRFERHRAFVMALDGQPAEPLPARDSQIMLGPGNRADVFLDSTLEPGASAPVTVETRAGKHTFARLVSAPGEPKRPAPLGDPAPLPANPLPARMAFSGAARHDLVLGWPELKSSAWSARPPGESGPLFSVKRGRVVMLALHNRLSADRFFEMPVVVHVHGHSFRLLDRLDDGWKPFWLDTLLVPAGTSRIAFVADNPGKWLIEVQGVDAPPEWRAAWFEVT